MTSFEEYLALCQTTWKLKLDDDIVVIPCDFVIQFINDPLYMLMKRKAEQNSVVSLPNKKFVLTLFKELYYTETDCCSICGYKLSCVYCPESNCWAFLLENEMFSSNIRHVLDFINMYLTSLTDNILDFLNQHLLRKHNSLYKCEASNIVHLEPTTVEMIKAMRSFMYTGYECSTSAVKEAFKHYPFDLGVGTLQDQSVAQLLDISENIDGKRILRLPFIFEKRFGLTLSVEDLLSVGKDISDVIKSRRYVEKIYHPAIGVKINAYYRSDYKYIYPVVLAYVNNHRCYRELKRNLPDHVTVSMNLQCQMVKKNIQYDHEKIAEFLNECHCFTDDEHDDF